MATKTIALVVCDKRPHILSHLPIHPSIHSRSFVPFVTDAYLLPVVLRMRYLLVMWCGRYGSARFVCMFSFHFRTYTNAPNEFVAFYFFRKFRVSPLFGECGVSSIAVCVCVFPIFFVIAIALYLLFYKRSPRILLLYFMCVCSCVVCQIVHELNGEAEPNEKKKSCPK